VKSVFLKFLKHIVIFTIILMTITLGLFLLLPRIWFSPTLPFQFFFFLGITLLSFHILLKSLHQRFSRFVNVFLITTVIKLALYIMVIIGYVYWNRLDALAFLISFFILYLCYTIFEVVRLVTLTKVPPETKRES
jgi:hypothetical protein